MNENDCQLKKKITSSLRVQRIQQRHENMNFLCGLFAICFTYFSCILTHTNAFHNAQHTLLQLSFLYRFSPFQTGHAIRCYDCNSHTDVGCSEKAPPKEFEKDCSESKNGPKYTFCRKITQIIEFSVNNCKLLAVNQMFMLGILATYRSKNTITCTQCVEVNNICIFSNN